MTKPDETWTRKSVSLPDSLWAAISDYGRAEQIRTGNEAARRLLRSQLLALGFLKGEDRDHA